ncbi:DNA repair helicase XPB [Paenibacillus sp. y28]|uniref:DNA repair helicase XPB n=1 Tax=Paenibacillus sp. y28 TaxID=3129110 RepID=UPI003016CC1C
MDKPLIVQSDMSVLIETGHPRFAEIRSRLSAFAELEKSPQHLHTYRMTPLSLWNAAAGGLTAAQTTDVLRQYSKYPVPGTVLREVDTLLGRFGLLRLERCGTELRLYSSDPAALAELRRYRSLQPYLAGRDEADGDKGTSCGPDSPGAERSPAAYAGADSYVTVHSPYRGLIKQELLKLGFPVSDIAGYTEGSPLDIAWREETRTGVAFRLREYQRQAADSFYAGGSDFGGSGVLVLPCGAGKTVIGIAAAIDVQAEVLVLTSSVTAARQWIQEFLDKTTLEERQIGEYSGEHKEIRPVTVATYHIVSHRPARHSSFPHLDLFSLRNWGLIIYDEVHLLPAPVFRITADIQAKRRLGLTATLVREDGMEQDVFSLIGPKKYDLPWKELEQQGWIATAACTEIRLDLTPEERSRYTEAGKRSRARIAAEAERKLDAAQRLLERHTGEPALVIGQYLEQLQRLAGRLNAPLISGRMPAGEREQWFSRFRSGEIKVLLVSKVANFAINLPDASIAIELSGQFGSRQEEAQRLGRLLRPKPDGRTARFYTLVTRGTRDAEDAQKRQRFLAEQGYTYEIEEWARVKTTPSRLERPLPV